MIYENILSKTIILLFLTFKFLSYSISSGQITNDTHFTLNAKYSGTDCKEVEWKIGPYNLSNKSLEQCCSNGILEVSNHRYLPIKILLDQDPKTCNWQVFIKYSDGEKGIEVSKE